MLEKQPYATFTVVDASRSASRMRFTANRGLEAVEILEAASDLRSRLSAITGCVFVRQAVTYPVVEDEPATAIAGVSSDLVAVFVFTTSTEGQYAVVDMPGIRPELVLDEDYPAGLRVDTEHPTVVAFLDAITSGMWCSVFGYDIDALLGTIVERRV